MSYEDTGGGLDYFPCHYGSSKLLVRGPRRRLQGDCIAFLGGSETFGKFVPAPYPALIEEANGVMSVNLGALNAGIDAYYHAPGLIDICAMARVTVIQIMGAINMSNRFYTVNTRHNDRFLRASAQLKALYPDIDFGEFHHTTHMLTALAQASREKFELVRREVQTAWVARMKSLMGQIGGTIVLLWMADHAPYCEVEGGTFLREPLFIDRQMIEEVQPRAARLVEVVAGPDDIERGIDELVYTPTERIAAKEVLGPAVHRKVAEALAPVLAELA